MENIKIKEAVDDAFLLHGADYKEMSLDDIALIIVERNTDFANYDLDKLRKQIASYMSNSLTKTIKGKKVDDKNSKYQRVKNGKGGFKKGVYKLRKPRKIKTPPIQDPIIPSPKKPYILPNTGYVGSAGEMAVCSELLFREYNVSRMSVDDGVDIVAIKNSKTYYIQVKTVQVQNESFGVKINSKSFDRYNSNDCYYIFVARTEIGERPINLFLIMTADDIKRLINSGDAKQGNGYITISFSQNMGSLFVKSSNVDYMLNSFDRIK